MITVYLAWPPGSPPELDEFLHNFTELGPRGDPLFDLSRDPIQTAAIYGQRFNLTLDEIFAAPLTLERVP